MTSQTFLMTSSVTSFDCKFKIVFDQTELCITFFLLALNLGELYYAFSRLKVKNCVVYPELQMNKTKTFIFF